MAIVSQFAAPSGLARPHSDLRVAPLRWASQKPPKLATASQFAAPRGGEAEFLSAYDATPLDPPGPANMATGSYFAVPRDGEASV